MRKAEDKVLIRSNRLFLISIFALLFSITPAIIPPQILADKAAAVSANPAPVCDGTVCEVTFEFTGDYYSWTAPKSATYTFKVWGAAGGRITTHLPIDGGRGGYSTGSKTLSEGETIYVFVGGKGEDRLGNHPYASCTQVAGGWNGGGATRSAGNSTPGGGASDVRFGGTALANRIIVAGGGGGSGWTYARGGAGGGSTGQSGTNMNQTGNGAGGGTQIAGGAAGVAPGCAGKSSGALGVGGIGGGSSAGGGGGGGGYYGGGGGGYSEGGGGGSSFVGGVDSGSTIAGDAVMPNPAGGTMTGRTGNGLIKVSYPDCTLGSKQECPGSSAMEIKTVTGTNTDGLYWILINGQAKRVYAIMNDSMAGGGWVLAMKSKLNSATFNYASSHWTTSSTLIPSGETNPAPLNGGATGNSEDAKYETFNSVNTDQILGVFRNVSVGGSAVTGGAIVNQNYGFTWQEDLPGNYKNTTLLNLFSTIGEHFIRDGKSQLSSNDYLYKTSANKIVFSTQCDVRFYGFNYQAENMDDAWEKKARWGFGWNENDGCSALYPAGNQTSNDAVGGIGLNTPANGPIYAAGDFNSCCVDNQGVNASLAYEIYVRSYPVAPAPPTSIVATSTGSTTATVAFTAPTRNGGAEVTSYSLLDINGNILQTLNQSGSGTFNVTGLNGSTSYRFKVKATNSAGASRESDFSNSITTSAGATVPAAPTITSITPGDGQLSVAFTAGANGGATITNYKYSTNDGSNWTAFNPATTTSPLVITGLTNRTSYTVKIRAVNSAGDGTASNGVAATPRASLTVTTPSGAGLSGTAGTAFSNLTISTSGGLSGRTFSIQSGRLPAGLSLNATTGVISGTPAESGSFPITVRVRDVAVGSSSDSLTQTADTNSFSLSIAATTGLSMIIKNESGRSQDLSSSKNTAFDTGCAAGVTSQINYNIWSGAPTINGVATGCNADGFTVYAKGSITSPVTGTVTFCAISDDGFYLRINNSVVIDNWIDQGTNANCNATGQINLIANTAYPIEIWHHENNGGAVMQLLWSYSGQATRVAVPSSAFSTSVPGISIITPTTGLTANRGSAYTLAIQAIGGSANRTFSITSGSLNALGLALNSSTGVISGTPNASGSQDIVVRVVDNTNNAQASTNTFTVSVGSVPGAPVIDSATVIGVTGNGKIKFSWNPPNDTGGSTITDYEIRYAISSVLSWSNWQSVKTLNGGESTTVIILSGLQSSKSYVAQVRAINGVGAGAVSAASAAEVSTGPQAQKLQAPLNVTSEVDTGKITLKFTANPISGINGTSTTLMSTMGETCTRENYWIVRSNVRYAHQFTAGSDATINKFEVRMGAGLQQYPSQIKIVIYANVGSGASSTVGQKLGELTYSSASSNIAVYTGSVAIPSAGTYWAEQQPTAAIANHYFCGTISNNSTGSLAGWAQSRTRVANSSNSQNWGYFTGTNYYYPMYRITTESEEAALNAITDYQYSLDGGTSWRSLAASSLPTPLKIDVTGLTNGTTYQVKLRAVNAFGPGFESDLGNIKVGRRPTPPTDPAIGQQVGKLTLQFNPPVDSGGSTVGYEYRIKEGTVTPAVPNYYPSGDLNVPITTITNAGWTLCWSGDMGGRDTIANIKNSCTGKYVLYAGGLKSNANYMLVGAGTRDIAFKETGNNVTNADNGLFWYFNSARSMGFAETSVISQTSADTTNMNTSDKRMSWHLNHCSPGNICGGWRIGKTLWLNSSTTYVRAIYQFNGASAQDDAGWSAWSDANTGNAAVTQVGNTSARLLTVSGITNNKTYSLQIRAKNEFGSSDGAIPQSIDARRASGPTITTQPSNQNLTRTQSSGVTLTVVATPVGQETLSYQWYKSALNSDTGTVITGATSASYVINTPINDDLAGKYYVIVTGTFNNTTEKTESTRAIVTVNAPPTLKTSTANKNGTVGSAYTNQLEVEANTGQAPLTWQLAPGSQLPTGLSLGSDGKIVGTPTISSSAVAAGASTTGSLAFNGTNSYLSLPASADWATGTGSFTVEWWQNQTDNSATTRIFSVGERGSASLAVSIEATQLNIWVGSTRHSMGSVGDVKNQWTHFAVVRDGNILRAYKNGVLLSSVAVTSNAANSTSPLLIGTDLGTGSYFGGNLTNFHFIKGEAKYTANFSPLSNISATSNSKLLLLASTSASYLLDSSPALKTTTPQGVSHATSSPAQGASNKDALQNGNFASPLVTDATKGWVLWSSPGGRPIISGGGLTFSYGSQACIPALQASARMGEVRQQVTVSTPGEVTFKVTVDARVWNRIGAGYSNPCHDPYQVVLSTPTSTKSSTSMATPGVEGRTFSTIATEQGAKDASDTLNESDLYREVTVKITTTAPNQVVTVSLFGLDAGYWAGNYGPRFTNATLTVPGGGSGGTSSSTVIITDKNGVKGQGTFTINIDPELTVTTKTLPNAATGGAYSQELKAAGGSGTYSWAVVGGNSSLPTGLTLTPQGFITGTVANNATSKSFNVTVTDGNGAVTTQSLSITVAIGMPGVPTGLTIESVSDGTAVLRWSAPTDTGGSAISQYIISYSASKGTDPDDDEKVDQGTVTVSATGLTFPYNLTGLKNGRTYSITVKAKNAANIGNSTNPQSATPVTVATAPTNFSMSLANGGLNIRWKRPANTGGNPVVDYIVQCSSDGNTWNTVSDRIDSGTGEFISVVAVTGFTTGTSYNCRVAARTTGQVVGTYVTSSSAITFATPPGVPNNPTGASNITYSNLNPGRVVVNWRAATTDGGAEITSYIATITRDVGKNNEVKRSCSAPKSSNGDTNGYSCEINGVPRKGDFTISVVAVNRVGTSQEKTVGATLNGLVQALTVPSSPRDFNSATTDASAVPIPLGTADFAIGATLDSGLTVKYTVPNTTTKCSVTERGLIKLLAVGICEVALNQDGKDAVGNESDYGPISQRFVKINVTDKIPGTPRFNTITPGNNKATVTWFAPSNTGGTPDGYRFQTAVKSGSNWSTFSDTVTVGVPSPLSTDITGLSNGSEYKIRMQAKNSGGSSDWVEWNGTFVAYGVPSKPIISSVSPDRENGSATITWTAPSDNGSSITTYEVSTTDGTLPVDERVKTCVVGGNATSCTIYGLRNKADHPFVLTAKNLAGSSLASETVTATILGLSQTITLLATPPGEGWSVGSPNYQIQATTNSGARLLFTSSTPQVCSVSSSTGSVTFNSSGACTIVISQDGVGTRFLAATNVEVNFTVAPAIPSAPTITTFTSAGSGLTVNWSAPSRTGGAIEHYKLRVFDASNNEMASCEVNALSCEITSAIVKGTIYTFKVYAKNAAGIGLDSDIRQAGWYAVPNAPVLTSVVASPSDGRAIDVKWNKSTLDGGSEIVRYQATATSGAITKSCTVASTGESEQSCTIRDLRAGAAFTVTVIAVNGVGSSSNSNSLTQTPGFAQTLTVTTQSPVTAQIGGADFQITASLDSGNSPKFTVTSNPSVCEVDARGVVRLLSVGTCTIQVNHPGAVDGDESNYKSSNATTITVQVAAVAPSAPRITKVLGESTTATVYFTVPVSDGGSPITNYDYSTDNGANWVTLNPASTSTSIAIPGLTSGSTYPIKVRARNSSAVSAASNAISVTLPLPNPNAPLPLVVQGGLNSNSLSWSRPTNIPLNTILRYEIYRRVQGVGSLSEVHRTETGTVTSFTDINLQSGLTYEYQVRAIANAGGGASDSIGDWTPSTFGSTFAAPLEPQSVTASASYGNDSRVRVSWLPPLSDGGSAITSYVITASPTGGSSSTYSATASARSFEVLGLSAGTQYTIAVKAVTAAGQSTDASTSITAIGRPSAPINVTATPDVSKGSVEISWSTPASTGGGTLTSYIARAYAGDLSTPTAFNCAKAHSNAATHSCTISGLAYKTNYVFAVQAISNVATGETSTATAVINLVKTQTLTFPELSEITWLTRSIILKATTSSGLAVSYTATPSTVCTVSGSVLTVTGIGTCEVVAAQSGAGSAFSAATSVTRQLIVTASKPSAPTLLSAVPAAGSVTATWSEATDLGGAASATYKVSYAINPDFSDEVSVVVSGLLTKTITGLTPGANYSVRVKTITPNYQTGSDWSNLLQATVLGVPGKPTNSRVVSGVTETTTVTSGPGTLTASWFPVDDEDNGGSPILGYEVRAYLGLDANPVTCRTSGTSCVIGGLDGSGQYTVRVYAINAVGESEPLEFEALFQPSAVQEIVAESTATKNRGQGSYKVEASASSGLPLEYEIISSTPTEPIGNRKVCELSANGTLIFDLAGECKVRIKQTGRDASGKGTAYKPAPDKDITITVQPDAPSNVVNFDLSSGNGFIDVKWEAPAESNDGGRGIKGYEIIWHRTEIINDVPVKVSDEDIESRLSSNDPALKTFKYELLDPTAKSYRITGLTNGLNYTVIVKTINKANLKSKRS